MKRLTLRGQMTFEILNAWSNQTTGIPWHYVPSAARAADKILSDPRNVEDVPETWAQVIGVPKPPTTDGTGRAP